MADEKEQYYTVLAPWAGTLSLNDVVPASALPSDPKAMIKEGTVRKATAEEVKALQPQEENAASDWDEKVVNALIEESRKANPQVQGVTPKEAPTNG